MNTLGAGTLDARELAAVLVDARALVADADTGTAVVYYPTGTRAYDPGAGTVSYGDAGVSLTAHVGPVDLDAIEGARVGDAALLVSASLLTAAPVVGDRFTAGGAAYAVYAAQTGSLPSHHTAYGHRVS